MPCRFRCSCFSLLLFTLLCLTLSACDVLAWHRGRLRDHYEDSDLKAATVELPSGAMHVFEGGQGTEPVLLVHGFGFGAMETWENQAEPFAERFHVLAPDLFWFGQSVPADPAFSGMAEDQAKAMIELLDARRIEKAHVVGVSFGGFVALEIARRYPERVDKLVLIDAAGLTLTEDEIAQVRRNFGNVENLEQILLPDDVETFRTMLDTVFRHRPWAPTSVLEAILREDIQGHHEVKQRIIARLAEGDLLQTDDLKTIRAKTLVAWGRHDPLLLPSLAERLTAAIPDARLVFFEDSGHTPSMEEPKPFNEVALAFLVGE